MEPLGNRLRLKELRLIDAIAQSGQLAIAAEQLAMTQPAASRMLSGVEKSIGSDVFIRHPKGMKPTAIGEVLARSAAWLIHGLDRTIEEVEAARTGRAGTVRVGAVTGGAVAFIVPAIQKLKQNTLGADIHVDVAPSDVLIDGLQRGEYDFVLSRIPPGTDARLFNIRRGRVEMMRFLVRAGHPLNPTGPAQLSDLAGYEWIVQAPHTPMRQAVEDAFANRQVPLPREIVNTTSLLVMLAYLASSDAISPISGEVADLLGSEHVGGNLRAIEIDDPIIVHAYHMVTLKSRVLNPIAVKLRDLVIDVLTSGIE